MDMKRFVRYLIIAVVAGLMTAPVADARNGRGNSGGSDRRTQSQTHSQQSGNRRQSSGSHSNQRGQRPTANGNHNSGNNNQRPGNNGNHNNGNNNQRPGNNGNHGNQGYNPGHGQSHNPGYVPGHTPNYRPGPGVPPGHRHWPVYHRPTPPRGYVWHGGGPSFGSILGMVLGMTFNNSLNYLYNNGYNVVSYGNNAIYLRNVMQLNYNWPDAVLYYNNGFLTSSQYICSNRWNDVARYNMMYNTLVGQYGMPVAVNTLGGLMSASWFGGNGRYVTIQYSQGYDAAGAGCYYTTLTFGN